MVGAVYCAGPRRIVSSLPLPSAAVSAAVSEEKVCAGGHEPSGVTQKVAAEAPPARASAAAKARVKTRHERYMAANLARAHNAGNRSEVRAACGTHHVEKSCHLRG